MHKVRGLTSTTVFCFFWDTVLSIVTTGAQAVPLAFRARAICRALLAVVVVGNTATGPLLVIVALEGEGGAQHRCRE